MRLPSGAAAVLLLAVAWALVSQMSQGPSSDHAAAGGAGLGATARSPNNNSTGGEAQGEGATVIVRFTSYRMAADHKAALAGAMKKTAWRWVPRHNPAAALPTDFGLLHLAEQGSEAVKAELVGLSFVKDVHPDRRLTRALMHEAAAEYEDSDEEEDSEAEASSGGAATAQAAPCGPGSSPACVQKRPGRMQTRPTFSLEDNQDEQENDGSSSSSRRRRLQQSSADTLTTRLSAQTLWEEGFKGQGVKVGVFDTGIKGDHPHVKNIKERSNWTHEPTLEDGLGHGSFVAGVIASSFVGCLGLAPEVDLYTFRVFTNDQVSFTSWFLDAFNYAIASGMNIVNLSIGGPDWLDEPFVEKVWEVTSAGIIMVSAIGNDGPAYGTVNNPADQNDVIGIGGIDYDNRIAPFSSRGMSTWELPLGYGRSKPDVMAFGRDVMGSRMSGGCRSLSGTSVASPVVAGVVGLLASTVPEAGRWQTLNPASMKQALVESAARLPDLNLYEQGAGAVDVVAAKAVLDAYTPRASVVPAALNLTDCPYMWPFCRQPLYAGAMPLMFNATVLNGMGLVGRFASEPTFTPSDAGGRLLDLRFEYSGQLWPWSGFLALYISVKPEGAGFEGGATGVVEFEIVSPPALGEKGERRSRVALPITAVLIPTPARSDRVLWDQFHSIRYPPAYFPRDDLEVRQDILDWHGDHPHTNFHDMYNALRDAGKFLEVLASPLTCFNASSYGALMIVDPEEEWYPEEVAKLASDVAERGLGLLVFGDWYDEGTVRGLRFYDDNTRSWWDAATGGANVPALNDLLAPFGAALGAGTLTGQVELEGIESFPMQSGTPLAAFPAEGHIYFHDLAKDSHGQESSKRAVLGLLRHGGGRVALYGDSNCLDSSHQRGNCHDLLLRLLAFAAERSEDLLTPDTRLNATFGSMEGLPQRRGDYNFSDVSRVLSEPIRCYPNAPLAFQGRALLQEVAVDAHTVDAGGSSASRRTAEEVGQAEEAGQEGGDREHPDLDTLAQAGEGLPENKVVDLQTQKPLNKDIRLGMIEQKGGVLDAAARKDSQHRLGMVEMAQVLAVAGMLAIAALWSVRRRRQAQGRRNLLLPTVGAPRERAE